MKTLLLFNFIIPVVMLLASVFLKYGKHPYPGPPSYGQTKWKVDLSGYNTPGSRKSQARWDYAQQIAPGVFLKHAIPAAVAAVLFGAAGFLWENGAQILMWCAVGIGFGCMIRAFRRVETALTDEFG